MFKQEKENAMLGYSIVMKKKDGRMYGAACERSNAKACHGKISFGRGSVARSVLSLSRKKRS